MKKLLVIAVAAASLVAMQQAKATVAINVTFAGDLLDHNNNLIPADGNSVGLLVEDINGLGAPTALIPNSQPLTVGSTILSDYLILGKADFTSIQAGAWSIAVNATLGGSIATGKQLDIIWLPGISASANSTPASGSSWYGSFYGAAGSDGSDPWAVPADGATINLAMITVSEGGSIPNSAGASPSPVGVVPEPSSISLVVLGVLGAVGIIRRRK